MSDPSNLRRRSAPRTSLTPPTMSSGSSSTPPVEGRDRDRDRHRRRSEQSASVPQVKDGDGGGDVPESPRSSPIPMAPPVAPDDEELEEHILGDRHSGWHYVPLAFVLIPSFGSIIHGRAEHWTDMLLLVLLGFYLVQLVKVPWEIYYSSRTRRILQAGIATDGELDPKVVRRQERAATELRRSELVALFFCLASPALGAWLLHLMKAGLSDADRYINPFNIRLFCLAAGIKPMTHFFGLVKRRALFLQEEVHYPSLQVEQLNRRVMRLEGDLSALRKAFATKSDVRDLRDGLDLPLSQLSKALRRSERKEEHLRLSAEERFALVESRMEDMLREVAINAELIDQIERRNWDARNRVNTFFAVANYFLGRPRVPSGASERQSIEQRNYLGGSPDDSAKTSPGKWFFERGALFYIFFPINLSRGILHYAGGRIGGVVERVEHIRDAAEHDKTMQQRRLISAAITSSLHGEQTSDHSASNGATAAEISGLSGRREEEHMWRSQTNSNGVKHHHHKGLDSGLAGSAAGRSSPLRV